MSKANRVKRSKFLSLFSIERIKSEILGETYELSFAFIETPEMQKLNKEYRGKDYPTDILSFPLSDTAGEILICKEVAKEKSKDFDMSESDYLVFLVIHGLLHLKGLDHGEEMESLEKKYLAKFK